MGSRELTIKIDDLDCALDDILKDYNSETSVIIDKNMNRIKKITLQKLKESSPSGKTNRAKKYKDSWRSKKIKGRLVNSVEVFNLQGQLTHLLENGHMIFNQFGGAYGRTSPQKHITPVQEFVKKELVESILKDLEKIK